MSSQVVDIHWKIERLDEGDNRDPRDPGCLLDIEGRIEIEGKPAGHLAAYYLLDIDLASSGAFLDLWDSDGSTCSVYEEIMGSSREGFREPLPRLLEVFPGMLVINSIAFRPEYRGIGLGRKVIGEFVRCCGEENTGAVLLNAEPLQHREGAYDYYDEEVRDLPWNGKEEDGEKLKRHLRSWGMHHIAGTRFMVAPPVALSEKHAAKWPPCPILCHWNTCVYCSKWIDLDSDGWEESSDGPIHKGCR